MVLSISLCAVAVCTGKTGASSSRSMCSIDSLVAASARSWSAPIWAGVAGASSPSGESSRPIPAGRGGAGSVALGDGSLSRVVGISLAVEGGGLVELLLEDMLILCFYFLWLFGAPRSG